jgi:3-isopropylmalate/(R)-2-methylmalate dehydratase small subunit
MTQANVLRKIWFVGDDIDTDALAPGAYMQHGIEVIAQHCLENIAPTFASGVQRGDVLVAGRNFGIGSSREQAAAALVHLGVAAVVAPSYSGLFFRNAFNLGLLLLTVASPTDCSALKGQETLVLDTVDLKLILPTGQQIRCDPVPDFLLKMVRAGGLLASLRLRMAEQASHA